MFGVKFGFLRAALVAAVLLFTSDYRTPATWGIGGNGTCSSVYATDEWTLQTPSAGAYPNDSISGGETLVNTGGLEGQEAIGLHNGSDYVSYKAWEATVGNQYLTASGTTAGNSDSEDFSARIVFRINQSPVGDYLLCKHAASGPGFRCLFNSSNLQVGIYDDLGNSFTRNAATGAEEDGSWNVLSFFYDHSAGMLYVKTKFGETSGSAAALTGSMSNAVALRINSLLGSTRGLQKVQVAYAGTASGANAQNFYGETVVLPGSTPVAATPFTTQSRASTISGKVSANRVCHFSGGTSAAAGCQLPIVWHEHLEGGAAGYGLLTNSARTNMIGSSESKSGWVNTSATTDNAANGPDGFHSAMQIVAPSNNFQTWDTAAAADSTAYTYSMWVRRVGATDVSFDLRLYDLANGTFLADTNFTATSDWVPYSVSGTSGVGVSNLYSYLRVTTLGEGIEFQFVQLNTGLHRGAYMRTSTGPASLVACNYEIDGISVGELWKGATGEIEISYVGLESDGAIASSYVFDGGVAGTNGNRRMMWLSGYGDIPQTYGYDSTGTSVVWIKALSVGLVDPTTQENTHVIKWDSAGTLAAGGGLDMEGFTDGVKISDDVGTFAGSDSADRIRIGGSRGGTNVNADVVISRFRAWSEERAA